jgi:hypothetical protein
MNFAVVFVFITTLTGLLSIETSFRSFNILIVFANNLTELSHRDDIELARSLIYLVTS